jgi:hypothetical protein
MNKQETHGAKDTVRFLFVLGHFTVKGMHLPHPHFHSAFFMNELHEHVR